MEIVTVMWKLLEFKYCDETGKIKWSSSRLCELYQAVMVKLDWINSNHLNHLVSKITVQIRSVDFRQIRQGCEFRKIHSEVEQSTL